MRAPSSRRRERRGRLGHRRSSRDRTVRRANTRQPRPRSSSLRGVRSRPVAGARMLYRFPVVRECPADERRPRCTPCADGSEPLSRWSSAHEDGARTRAVLRHCRRFQRERRRSARLLHGQRRARSRAGREAIRRARPGDHRCGYHFTGNYARCCRYSYPAPLSSPSSSC